MVYGTGGIAVTDISSGFTFVDTFASNASGSFSTTKVGFVVGGGVEAAVWNGWSIKAEYLYADFGATSTNSNNFVSSGVAIPATSFTHSDNLKANILRVGINYRFGTF